MPDKLNVTELRETLGPKPGTCYRNRVKFEDDTDRLRIRPDGGVECVKRNGRTTRVPYMNAADCEMYVEKGFWIRVPDAPQGGSQ